MEVLTSDGFKTFSCVKITERKEKIHIIFHDGKELKCTPDHKILFNGKFTEAQYLKNDVEQFEIYEDDEPVYDLVNVEDTHHYITNGITSHNCVYIDECAFVPANIWEEFYKSTYPTISSGKETRLILTSTPNGENHFYDIWRDASNGKNVFKPIEVGWQEVPGRDDVWRKETISNIGLEAFEQEFNNSFQVNNSLLLSMDAIHRMKDMLQEPEQYSKNIHIYEQPKPGHLYFCACDCADLGIDYSTIQIIDVTQKPFRQVAVFHDNKIPFVSFPQIIVNYAHLYNNAEVLVESNAVGDAVLHILNYEIEYGNIAHTMMAGKNQLGLRTTTKTKALGCSTLKTLIETRKLDIIDRETADEFKHFALKNNSYEAEEGYHDDLVMALVIFGYYSNTPSFTYRYENSLASEFNEYTDELVENQLMPLPIFAEPMMTNKDTDLYVTDVTTMSDEDKDWLLGVTPNSQKENNSWIN